MYTKRIISLLFVTFSIFTISFSQNKYPSVFNNQIYLGKSFNEVRTILPHLKWFSSNTSPDKITETYIFQGKVWDSYITYNGNDSNLPIIEQLFSFQGNRATAKNYFFSIINNLKNQGGYEKVIDRKYSPNVCQFFYRDIKITISLDGIQGSQSSILTISCNFINE